mgnify:CR=1 FL=1
MKVSKERLAKITEELSKFPFVSITKDWVNIDVYYQQYQRSGLKDLLECLLVLKELNLIETSYDVMIETGYYDSVDGVKLEFRITE